MKKVIKKVATAKKTDFKHGQWFKANIQGEECVGRVSIHKKGIYLCQDENNGATVLDKLGFDYSWGVLSGSMKDLRNSNVENLVLLSRKPASYKKPVKLPNINGYITRITNNGETVKVGCTPVSRELYLEVGRIAGWIEE